MEKILTQTTTDKWTVYEEKIWTHCSTSWNSLPPSPTLEHSRRWNKKKQ